MIGVIEDGVLRLWLLPIYLRTKQEYYKDSDKDILRLLDSYWETSNHIYTSRAEFNSSDVAREIRMEKHPPPWRFNDIIGWISIDASPGSKKILVELVLTKARFSRQLKQKSYVVQDFKYVFYSKNSTNEEVRQRVFKTADELLKASRRVRKCHVNLASWERLLAKTDIIGLLHDASQRMRTNTHLCRDQSRQEAELRKM